MDIMSYYYREYCFMIVQEMFHSKAVVGEISCPIPSELSQVGRFQVKSVGGSRFIDLGLAADRIAGPCLPDSTFSFHLYTFLPFFFLFSVSFSLFLCSHPRFMYCNNWLLDYCSFGNQSIEVNSRNPSRCFCIL